jgi:transposase
MDMEIRGAERLSFRERQVVALKELGHSTDEIAGRLGIAPATVAALYHRARVKGFQVVLVLSGDPLRLYARSTEPGAAEESDDAGGREAV